MVSADNDINEALDKIIIIQEGLSDFWKNIYGWGPDAAAELLSKSRLDWLPSLAHTLKYWTKPDELTPGELILAWANIGSLLEGTLKLFLSAYLDDYNRDALLSKSVQHNFGKKQGLVISTDELSLEGIRKFLTEKKIFKEKYLKLIQDIQHQRNIIHAFKDKPLKVGDEFQEYISVYLGFVAHMAMRLPHPDEYHPVWLSTAYEVNYHAQWLETDFLGNGTEIGGP